MKTLGLLGGMSWESTGLYYRLINQETRRRLGGLHSAPIAMVSVDFQPIEELQHRGDWPAATEILIRHAQQVEAAGADFLLICTNTMHKIAPQVVAAIDIPLLHIADATAKATHDDGLSWECVRCTDGPNLYAVSFAGSRGIAVGQSCAAFLTEDGGATWRDVSCGLDTYLGDALWISENEVLAVGQWGTVLRLSLDQLPPR